jgi:hypothetical protein
LCTRHLRMTYDPTLLLAILIHYCALERIAEGEVAQQQIGTLGLCWRVLSLARDSVRRHLAPVCLFVYASWETRTRALTPTSCLLVVNRFPTSARVPPPTCLFFRRQLVPGATSLSPNAAETSHLSYGCISRASPAAAETKGFHRRDGSHLGHTPDAH